MAISRRKKEELVASYIEQINSSDAIIVHSFTKDNKPGKIVEVNDAMCQRYGYSRDELLQMQPQDIDNPEGVTGAIHDVLPRLLAEGYAMWESVHVTKSRCKIPVEIVNTIFEYHGEKMSLARST